MRVNLGKGEWVETDNASMQDLRALRDILMAEVKTLKDQMKEEYRVAMENGGIYRDVDRYERLLVARKKRAQAIEQLRVIMADRQRREEALLYNRLNGEFVRICKERMPHEVFHSLLAEAQQRAGGKDGGGS